MKMDFEELRDSAETAVETEQKVSEVAETSGSTTLDPGEMTLTELKNLMQAEEELNEILDSRNDSTGIGEAITELAKDDEVRGMIKQGIAQLKSSGNNKKDVKVSNKTPDTQAEKLGPSQPRGPPQLESGNSGNSIDPDEMFNFTQMMVQNVMSENPDMTVEELHSYISDNEGLIKREMKQIIGE